ncbi:hypothetical protein DDB_G0284491 [Dictyostelium discoideum AX4]|uniref:Probable serine/threonine-protein kinase DDB_G0284491 n=1 Tax=Dictyostelium discoideum TaxID=44689 RepID=Y4491_DICDI|nr:hypothetical protein DDB_G0284491 [Dictyostelium discoideum AX4]Q54PK8.1 RecName: Full=Probable serine/threonine-protein kinase DDB_G0284491 [Dictyostelium discoideum]EAL65172.1 hypothetical protein DDB_G0284491 [Dictyostelium discoideum AX4]|eukprot:XP_638524.1 hypothetical protein DDB_G0284491 [Dictyostelium discoideum AX4]
MSDYILSAEINLPLLKWMTSFKLNSNLFSTSRNQSLKSISEIYRDLQYNIIPPKDEELQNLWTHLYDLNNYYSNSIEYNQVEKSLMGLKSKYRNSYLKGYYEIINLFQSIANDFEKLSSPISQTTTTTQIPIISFNKNSVLDAINNRKNENKENSFKFLSSFESYVPTVEEIKRIYCIDNKEILIDKSCTLPVEYKLFHSFSLLNLYVYLIIVIRIIKLIGEINRQSSNASENQEILHLLKEYSLHIKSIEEFQLQLKLNNLYYQPTKKEIILKYFVEINSNNNLNNLNNNNDNNLNNNNSNNNLNNNNNSNSNFNNDNNLNSNINSNDTSISNNNSIINNNSNNSNTNNNNNNNIINNIKIFEFSEKELKYSKRYYSYNEFTLRPAELPNNSLGIETQNLIFYTTSNYNSGNSNSGSNNSNSSNNNSSSNSLINNSGGNSNSGLIPKIKFNHHRPKDINPKIVLAVYNNILSMSKVIDKKTINSMNEIIKNNNNNNNNNSNNNNNNNDEDDSDYEENEFNKEFNNQFEFGSEIIEQDKECYICRFRSEFISFCNYCKCKMICDLCSVNKVCWNCYFKVDKVSGNEQQQQQQHFIPLEVVVKLKDRKYPRLIYMLLRSYSFRDLMNTLYQDRFERDSVISPKDRFTYKLHKTKLYNFHLVLPNCKNPFQTKEIQIFDDYSLIIALRLLMNFILSNYIIDQKEVPPPPTQPSSRPQSPPTVSPLTPLNNHHHSGGSLLEHAIARNFNNNSVEVVSDDNTSGSGTGGSNSNSNTGGSYNKFNNNNNNRKNSTGSGTNSRNNNSDNEYSYNNNNNNYNNNNNNKIINNNSIVTVENPILWNIDKFILNVIESSIDIEQSLKIPSSCIETEIEPFASGGQANIYMVKHIDWPMLSNCPEGSYVFKQFIETKDSLQLEEDIEREMYEEKIYQTYKTGESVDNFKYNFSNVEQTDKKSLETLFYEEVDKLKRLQFSDYIIKMPAISDDNPNKRGMLLECATAGSLKTNLLEYRSWKLVIRFMMDICLGMIDIHKCQIIHRDLKPDNILVFENFNSSEASDENDERQREFGGLICKITDLGASIQKELVHDNNFTSTFHTDDYVPEEYGRFQYDGEKVDIYSFGCTFFEMVTKHRYQYKHPTPLHRDFLTTDFQYIPIRIKTLIASLLAEQSQRKQSFNEVYNDLQDIYKNVIPGLPDIPLSPISTNGSQFCKRCNPQK